MKLSIPCKSGKILIDDDDVLRIRPAFGSKVLWETPTASITRLTVQAGMMAATVTIHATGGYYQAEMVATPNVKKLLTCFPNVPTVQVGKEWWLDPVKLTHVAVYMKPRDMQKEMEQAYQHGWQVQGQSGTGGFVDFAGFWLRGADRTTITYTRSPEWLSANR